ncbi:Uncharacterised protein [Acinetobacter baumannii]|nr:Uncharacterised protein [Acinetobacter baumannii]
MTLIGTLPGRKPGILARRAVCCRRLLTSVSIRSAGTPTVMRRSRAEVLSTETCMDIPRCTDVSRSFRLPESRACILVEGKAEVTPPGCRRIPGVFPAASADRSPISNESLELRRKRAHIMPADSAPTDETLWTALPSARYCSSKTTRSSPA